MDYENIAGLAAAAAVLGFLWSIKSDIVGVHKAIAEVHRDMAGRMVNALPHSP